MGVLLTVLLSSFLVLPSSPSSAADSTKKAVAVLYFDNHTGDARYDPFGKGLASMMITDLSSVEAIQLVEREHLESLIQEMKLQQSAFFDPETAVQVGHFVGAEYVIIGAINAAKPIVRLDSRVVRVETSEIVKTARASGKDNELFQIQGHLADELIEGLDIALSPEQQERLRQEREANRINDVETALAYSEALHHYDRGDYVTALERMNYVRQNAPASRLAELTYEAIEETIEEKAKEKGRNRLNRFLRKKLNDG